jgi:hypothetical protein
MRHAARALLAGGLGFAVSLLVACGGGAGLLSSDQANRLNSKLDQLSLALDAHQCSAANRAASSFSSAVANLPSTVNTTLQANLNQGASTLAQRTAIDCSKTTTTTTTTSSTTTSSTTSSSTTTETPFTTTTAAPPTSTPATTQATPGTTSTGGTTGGAGLGGAADTTRRNGQ